MIVKLRSAVTTLIIIIVAGAALIGAAGPARGPESSTVAAQVVALMAEQQLDAFAAQDPTDPNRFVATLLVPGSQMLVVTAAYPNPAELQAQIAQKKYRDVYAALHQPASTDSRFFLIDTGCDGLRSGAETVDVLYEKGKTQTVFDGDWKKQGLSQASYRERLEKAEKHYAGVLGIFRDSLKAAAAGQSGK